MDRRVAVRRSGTAPPTTAELDQLARRRRRATTARAGLVAVPVALLVALAVWWTARSTAQPDRLDDAVVTTQEDQSDMVWFADGELHLDHVVLAVGPVLDVTSVGDGAVYLDPTGRVVHVGPDGARDVLGHMDPALPLRADGASGWVAWVDTDTGKTVVEDLTTGRRVATRSGDRAVVAVDFQEVYLRNGAGGLRDWQPLLSRVRRLPDADLLDVRGRRAAVQATPSTITVVQLASLTEFTRPGRGADLSAHGGYVSTSVDGGAALYDTLTGLLTRSGLRYDDTILAAAGGAQGATTYVVQTARGQRLLEDCVVQDSSCTIAEQLDPHGQVPLLAR